ncbi:MAG: TetR/AcrR family transcriptional regulator [Pseudomonadota bacterium]
MKRPGEKRQRTRAQLLEAARAVIREKGFHAVSMDEVARRAGMSRGAIYGNFTNREDLIFGVVESLWQQVTPRLVPGASLRAQLRIIGEAVAAAAVQRRPMAVGAASFQVFALSHPRMRRRIARENQRIYTHIATELVKFIPADQLTMPVERFVRVTHALSDGLMFGHFMTPELIDREVIVSAFEALAGKPHEAR